MNEKERLMFIQINKVIDANPELKELKVSSQFYEFIKWKYKSDTFRGVKLVLK